MDTGISISCTFDRARQGVSCHFILFSLQAIKGRSSSKATPAEIGGAVLLKRREVDP